MGSAYVDDHRFSLYQGGQWRDITAWVGSPEARDKLEALSVELTFSVLRNQLYDAGMPWPGVRCSMTTTAANTWCSRHGISVNTTTSSTATSYAEQPMPVRYPR